MSKKETIENYTCQKQKRSHHDEWLIETAEPGRWNAADLNHVLKSYLTSHIEYYSKLNIN